MDRALASRLLELKDRDEKTRADLVASGELFDGYHPRMAAVHDTNAARLAEIVERWGWPGRSAVGDDGADAAWLILQHAIATPELMRYCLPLVRNAAHDGEVPCSHAAFLEDRICTFEGRPQRYGTQFDWDENGQMSPLPLLDPETVDRDRAAVGLGPLQQRVDEIRSRVKAEGAEAPSDLAKRNRERAAWARSVGWRN